MSVLTSSPQPHPPHIRPPSRSERLLRDTLRKDDTLRTITSPHARPSSTCSCDPEEDENLFQSTLLLRSTRRNSATSISSSRSRSRAHTHPRSCYIPDDDEHTSYARLLRSSSFSGSFRSKRSEPKSPQYTSLALEKQEDAPLHVHDAPHEAVLRTRLEHVLHLGMREVKREAGTSSIEASLVFLLVSIPSVPFLWCESLTTSRLICSPQRGPRRHHSCPCRTRAIPTSQNTPTSPPPKAMLTNLRRHHPNYHKETQMAITWQGVIMLRAPCPRRSPAQSNPMNAPQGHPDHFFRRHRGGRLIHLSITKNKVCTPMSIPAPRG